MYNIVIFDENIDNLNKINDELVRNKDIKFTKILKAKNELEAVEILYNSTRNNQKIDIFIQNIEMIKRGSINIINILDTIVSEKKPKIVLYTSNNVIKIAKSVFSDKVDFLILNMLTEENLADQILDYCSNTLEDKKTVIKVSKEEYIRTAILKINNKDRLMGYTYLFEACRLCINDPKKLIMQTKNLYEEVGKNCGTDITTVDRSIRNLITRGIKEDKLAAFCEYTNINIVIAKISNGTVISAIVIGYQNMSSTYL